MSWIAPRWLAGVGGGIAALVLTVGAAWGQGASVRVQVFADFVAIPPSGFLAVAPERDAQGAMRYLFIRRQRTDSALCEITIVRPEDLPPEEAEAFPLLTPEAVLRAVVSSYEAESPVAEIENLPEYEAGQNRYTAARLRLLQPRGGMGATELYVRRTPDMILIVRAGSASRAALETWRGDLHRLLTSLTPVAQPPAPATPPPPSSDGGL